MKARWVWVPLIQPLPRTPPEPMAMVDWMMWKPLPRGSEVGSSRVQMRCFWYSRRPYQSTPGWHQSSPYMTTAPTPTTPSKAKGPHQEVDRGAERRVGADAGIAVGAAALQAEDQVARAHRHAPHLVR